MTTSMISWLDHSEADRRRMLAVIDLFRDQGTVDELGTSAIWDALANLLFPGTGTVQTRARYFLIVPWVFNILERDRVPGAKAAATARRLEIRVIDALLAGDPNQVGVIGKLSRAELRRLPSAIYWSGLGRLGIRVYGGTIDQLLRSLDAQRASRSRGQRDDDGELVEPVFHPWHVDLPPIPDGFPNEPLHFELTWEEAEFLRERIRTSAPMSMLDVLLELELEISGASFPWHHPDVSSFPASLRSTLHHAQRFSEAVHGAALLYNLVLARQKKDDELIGDYEDRLEAWERNLDNQAGAHRRWDRAAFWAMLDAASARVHPFAHEFVERWCGLLDEEGFRVATSKGARKLITDRERQLKGGLARVGNQQALDRWVGHSGDRQYDFRWASARTILRDIKHGLAFGEAT